MATSSRKSAYDLTHQQSDILDYITEIAQELAQMADRAGCSTLGHDLRRALLTAHGSDDISPTEGNISNSLDGERSQKRL